MPLPVLPLRAYRWRALFSTTGAARAAVTTRRYLPYTTVRRYISRLPRHAVLLPAMSYCRHAFGLGLVWFTYHIHTGCHGFTLHLCTAFLPGCIPLPVYLGQHTRLLLLACLLPYGVRACFDFWTGHTTWRRAHTRGVLTFHLPAWCRLPRRAPCRCCSLLYAYRILRTTFSIIISPSARTPTSGNYTPHTKDCLSSPLGFFLRLPRGFQTLTPHCRASRLLAAGALRADSYMYL